MELQLNTGEVENLSKNPSQASNIFKTHSPRLYRSFEREGHCSNKKGRDFKFESKQTHPAHSKISQSFNLFNKRLILDDSLDSSDSIDEDVNTNTESFTSIGLQSEIKSEHFDIPENSERDIGIDDDISHIEKCHENSHQGSDFCFSPDFKPRTRRNLACHNQLLSKILLIDQKKVVTNPPKVEDQYQNLEQEEVGCSIFDNFSQLGPRRTVLNPKINSSPTPLCTGHEVYYLFQYHRIDQPIDWLFLPEDPSILLQLLSDQQVIYAGNILSMITSNMPDSEIMPCYLAFKGMIALFSSDFLTAYNYFHKASIIEDNLLFLFWKAICMFYIWMQSETSEDRQALRRLVGKFDTLSQFNINIKWIILKIRLYEYSCIETSEKRFRKTRDSALEIKSLNQYFGRIAQAEIYAVVGKMDKCMHTLHNCVQLEPKKVHAYIRLYHYNRKVEEPRNIYGSFTQICQLLEASARKFDQQNEIRHRLMTLLCIRACVVEGQIDQAISIIRERYTEDSDKLSLLIEFAKIVTEFGNTQYLGEALGALEEVEKRGCTERNRELYFLMAQIEVLRGNIMAGYKLFMTALCYLNPLSDQTKIDYIKSFICPYKENITKVIELERLLENNTVLSHQQYEEAVKGLELVQPVDKKYCDLLQLKLHARVIKDSGIFINMIDEAYKQRHSDINLCIFNLETVFEHQDLITMVYLRDQLMILIEDNKTISTSEYIRALDLIYRTYNFQGKYRNAIEILDRINSCLPSLPEDQEFEKYRRLVHASQDQIFDDTMSCTSKNSFLGEIDFTQIEKINISRLIMKENKELDYDPSGTSEVDLDEFTECTRETLVANTHQTLFNDEQTAENLLKVTDNFTEFESVNIRENNENANEPNLSNSNSSFDNTRKCSFDEDLPFGTKTTFRTFSDPKYLLEKGKLCCKIIRDFHAKLSSQQENYETELLEQTSLGHTLDVQVIFNLTSRDYKELLEEGLEALVEFLLNLLYRKQYYRDEGFEAKKETVFFWISICLYRLNRHEESLAIIRKYSHNWNHNKEFINCIKKDMVDEETGCSESSF
ncbi:unnamed protein product [Moneuplotes crassus]|uniref:Uncharacterized protein n=1 Tax=Euplotes crassus TaxID=5936 RepID=A0AAD2D240_EUPCR|nr:unnamed protein product [Moneuplotes crassus]